MQFYANSNRQHLKTILFFLIIVFIAFLPVSSFLFSLKNDAFTGYFPPKFFMSQSIYAGHLPLWNPYINFGIPQYGDMSGGYWSPVTWLIAATVGYNAYTFTIELLLYILLGGIGIYKLTGAWQLVKNVRVIAAVSFMCCGFTVGHLQHFNWLSAAAFLPWCFWSYHNLLQQKSLKNILFSALFFYLLISSAHPGISISAVYFFGAYFIFNFFNKNKDWSIGLKCRNYGLSHLALIAILCLLSAGMIYGYMDFIPHFVRGEKITLADSLLSPANAQSWISSILPFATVKNNAFYNTDISMRNSYFSLVLLLFFISSLFTKKTALQKFLLFTGLCFLLLASGGIFKTIAYKFIPFIGYVRLNGEFRIFAMLSFILVAAIELDFFIKNKKTFSKSIKWIYYFIEIILFVAIIFGLSNAVSNKDSIIYNISNVTGIEGLSQKLKALIEALSFYDTFWIQGIIQLFILWGIKYALKISDWDLLKKIVVADMIIACLLNIPFTGVGKASLAEVQSILNKSPKGIPIPKLIPIQRNDSLSTDEKLMVGDWSFYNKQIGTKEEASYPITLKNMRAYFEKDAITKKENHLDKAFIFTEDSVENNIKIHFFSPQKIELTVNSNAATNLVLQQNYYPHWFYFNGKLKKEVDKYGINFMSVPIEKGMHKIIISFEPIQIKKAMLLSLAVFIFCCLWLFFLNLKPISPSSQRQSPGP